MHLQSGWTVDCIEVDADPPDPLTGLIAGRLLGKLVPPRTSADWIARTRRLLPKLQGYDVVVGAATEISFGLAIWKSLGRLRKPLVGILLGAGSFPIGSELRRLITASMFVHMHCVLFSDAEEAEIRKRFKVGIGGLSIGWFGVDEKFWVPPEDVTERSGILSVGNDGRRDYDTLVKVAGMMPDHEFTILTRFEAPYHLPGNGRWRCMNSPEKYLSLKELLPLYQSSQCVVLPLKESLQPSGQSVAMQAMMCGAPVVITKTQGWWGSNVIRNGKEVALVESGGEEELAKAIQASASTINVFAARNALLGAKWTVQGFAERLGAVIQKARSSR
jgi:glycosyltransferase involved in cell wall biosynthesis